MINYKDETYLLIGNVFLVEMPTAPVPKKVKNAWVSEMKKRNLKVKLKYITANTVKGIVKKAGGNIRIGNIGLAVYSTNTAYVVESENGIEETIATALHELRHFYDGPHPWKEEEGNYKFLGG